MKYITIKSRELRECKNNDDTINNVYILTFKKGDIEENVYIKDVTDTGDTNLKDLERQARKKFKHYVREYEKLEASKKEWEVLDKDWEVIK